jgi:hypothetical protein
MTPPHRRDERQRDDGERLESLERRRGSRGYVGGCAPVHTGETRDRERTERGLRVESVGATAWRAEGQGFVGGCALVPCGHGERRVEDIQGFIKWVGAVGLWLWCPMWAILLKFGGQWSTHGWD